MMKIEDFDLIKNGLTTLSRWCGKRLHELSHTVLDERGLWNEIIVKVVSERHRQKRSDALIS